MVLLEGLVAKEAITIALVLAERKEKNGFIDHGQQGKAAVQAKNITIPKAIVLLKNSMLLTTAMNY